MGETVEFQPGCVALGNAIVCSPGGVVVRDRGKCWGLCGKDGARRTIAWPNSGYYGPTVSCECGDKWADGEMYGRPFRRGWRKEAQTRFEAAWEKALPEGAKANYGGDPKSDDFAWLVSVTLPDGTVVTR